MIGLLVAAGWLELAAGTLTLDVSSPYFNPDTVPGTLTYPFGVVLSPANLVRLNFPHVRAAQGETIAPESCQLYLDGVLRWVGSLVYLSCDEAKQLFEYSFLADAADLQTRIDGVNLPTLDLGEVALELRPDAADYALPCLRNSVFYEADKVSYCGVVNYYQGGSYQLLPGGKRSPLVPFPRLVPLLRRVLGAVGYAVSGPWLKEAANLVIYSDRAVELADGKVPDTFPLNRHVPDIGVGALLTGLQKFLGLAFDFHPVRRELRIRSLRDVLADTGYVEREGGPARTTAVTAQGFTLTMGLESDDELNKTQDTGWTKLVVGAGKEAISTDVGTLHVLREADPVDDSRQWLVPAVEAKGASPAFDTGDDSRCGLRLLTDYGIQPAGRGEAYPLAGWDVVNYAGDRLGSLALRWGGEWGLYAQRHAAWLDFLGRAATREATMQFRVADLLTLDPARKELVQGRKYLWEKVTLKIPTTGRPLESADYTYRYCRL